MLGPLMLDLAGTELSPLERGQLLQPVVGGVILFSRNYTSPAQLAALVQDIRAVRAELLIAADTEGGRVQRFRKGFLRLPAVARYGEVYESTPEEALRASEAGGWLLAAELRALDIDLAFAPVVDIDTGVSQVIGDRAFAGNAQAVAALAAAHSRGMRSAGMAATAKHFPGHGFVAPDSHKELPEDPRELAIIQEQDWAPYRTLIADGLESVMVAHVRYGQVDDLPASISPVWIKQHLHQDLAFSGAVFSDDLSMGGLARYGDAVARMIAALTAGCDMIPVCNRPADVAEILDRVSELPLTNADEALRKLRGQGDACGLDALRRSEMYDKQIRLLHNTIKVEVEI